MKQVVAVINPHKIEATREALIAAGIQGMTVVEAKGFGRQRGKTETYRGAEYEIEFVPKAEIQVAVADDQVEGVVTAIQDAVRTGKIGDGKIFVIPVEEVIRIRTGEKGAGAL